MGSRWFRLKSDPRERSPGTSRGSRTLAISARALYLATLVLVTVLLFSSVFEFRFGDLAESVFGIDIDSWNTTSESPTGEAPGSAESESTTADAARTRAIQTAKDMISEGSLAEAVDYVNGEAALSPSEQQEVLESLDGPDIIERLLASQNPIARRIGQIFRAIAGGDEVSQGEMSTELQGMGVRGGTALTYLGLFVRVKKHARSRMFRGAIASLAANPHIADAVIRAPSTRPEPAAAGGRKIALLIGVEAYREPLPSLTTPLADVKSIGALLEDRLGYETRILKNATKDQMLEAFQALVDEVREQDSLVVYYAGHGYILEADGLGYWLPADARTDTARQWLSNRSVSEFLSAIRAKNIMLVADSCYSGTLLSSGQSSRGVKTRLNRAELRDKRAVMILSSGGEEPVQDESGAGHSVFARQLITMFEGMDRDRLGVEVYETVKARVAEFAPQVPQYGGAISAGHEAGADYLFEADWQGLSSPLSRPSPGGPGGAASGE